MKKCEAPRVEHLARTTGGGLPVNFVAKDRVSDRIEMHPNLMRAPGKNLTQYKGPGRFFLDDPPGCSRSSPRVDYRHFLPMHGMAPDRFDYLAVALSKSPDANGEVKLLHLSPRKLAA